jgi:hypothetical protein
MRFRIGTLIALLAVMTVAEPAFAQRGTSFNRVTSVRREGAGGSAGAARNGVPYTETSQRGAGAVDPLLPYTSRPQRTPAPGQSLGNPGTKLPEPAPPAPDRSVAHTYYPAMRSAQGPNRNVATHGRCTQGRGSFLARGAMGLGPPALLPVPSPAQRHR